jgi:hypothetical protein
MNNWKSLIQWVVPCLFLAQTLAVGRPSRQAAATSQKIRPIGVVTEIQSGQLTLHTDAGPSLTVSLPDGISVLQVPPGAKSLKQATKITTSDISVGDRVLIIGPVSEDQKSVAARTVVVMSKSALETAREAERSKWGRLGIAGVVKSVDLAAKQIILAVPNTSPKPGELTHPVTVALAPDASLLRYAPDSVKFSDAKPAPLADVHIGDQMRALGTKSADGTHYTAEKAVFGTFRNIGATVISVDAPQETITVKDLSTGKPILVRTNAESKLHQLTPAVASTIARFNAASAGKGAAAREKAGGPGEKPHGKEGFRNSGGPGGSGENGGPPEANSGNLDQMLQKMPSLSLSALKQGEPLIIVSTEGVRPGEVTAIDILSGVEPILRAQPKGSKEVGLGPWNMSVGGGGGSEAGGGESTGSP